MGELFIDAVKQRYRLGHRRVLRVLEGLTEEQMRWHPTPVTHSISWNAWHLGRWADYLQAQIPAMTPRLQRVLGPRQEIWETENSAAMWGFDPAILGWRQMGTDMDDEIAASLPFPDKDTVVGYMRRSFEQAAFAVARIADEEFGVIYRSPHAWAGERPIGMYVVALYAHNERHLGQIIFLRRLTGLPWSLEQPGWTSV
ncbi:MAG: DinB family protein [Armatimonadota bacterium]